MNKQKIKKAICVMENLKYLLIDVLGNKNNEKEFDVAIEMLEKQLANGWIPVSERLPEKVHDKYLVTMKHRTLNEYCIDCRNLYSDYQFEYASAFERHNWEVIAWMPLPEPYKEDDEE